LQTQASSSLLRHFYALPVTPASATSNSNVTNATASSKFSIGFPLALNAYRRATGGPKVDSVAEVMPRWVSPRGALAYLGLAFRPGRDGFGLAGELLSGAAATVLSDWRRFRDPAHAHPAAWADFVGAAGRRLGR
jgi:hypothetical protein